MKKKPVNKIKSVKKKAPAKKAVKGTRAAKPVKKSKAPAGKQSDKELVKFA